MTGGMTSGTLLVGTDTQPGTYSYTVTSSFGGYWERLSCLTGHFDCIIANEAVMDGKGYVTVTPDDVALKIQGIELS